VSRSIWTIVIVLLLAVGCTAQEVEEPGESADQEAQSSDTAEPELPHLTLREAYVERPQMRLSFHMVDDESLSYFGVVWRDETGEWNAIYEGQFFTIVLVDHRYAEGALLLTIHTWGEREETRTPTFVYEVRYTESDFADDLRLTDGQLHARAEVVARLVGQLEEES
jgi:hypothetical protein